MYVYIYIYYSIYIYTFVFSLCYSNGSLLVYAYCFYDPVRFPALKAQYVSLDAVLAGNRRVSLVTTEKGITRFYPKPKLITPTAP